MELLGIRVQLKATLLTPRSDEYKKELTEEFVNRVIPLFKQKKIKPIVDQIFPFADIQHAHKYMEANNNIGKIILHVN